MQKTLYPILIICLLLLVQGCGSFIFDNLSGCPQGMNFSFHQQTTCESEPSYPVAIKQVQIFAFDEKNILVDEFSAKDITLAANYLLETSFYQVGKFSFIAWGSENLSSYEFTAFEKGKSSKQDLSLSMKRELRNINKQPQRIYYSKSEMLTIADRSDFGSAFDFISFNMQELTNRVRFTILGLNENDDYSIVIKDNNSIYTVDGNIAPDTSFNYKSPVYRDADKLKVDFVLMKLAENRNTRLIIHNTTNNREVCDINLIDDLIMYSRDSGEPPYKLECDSDFDILIKFENNMLVQAIVNDWNLVSRPVTLGK